VPTIIPIAEDDPRLELYWNIRERDLVGRDGHFIAEGEVVLKVLVAQQHRHDIRSVLVAESRVEKLRELLDGLAHSVPVFVAPSPVFEHLVGFPMHRGILALASPKSRPTVDALLGTLPASTLVLVLVGITNHDNVGGIFRNAAAFGVEAVLLDTTSCDPLYRKAIRVSVGGTLVVPYARLDPGVDPIVMLEQNGFRCLATSPQGDRELRDVERSERMAVLFGTEGPGLPESILARADTVRIAMASGFDSLNVATTSGIVLHHLTC
jgi:tRNA G18 (ribose-2'-O)-methylase SpoU